MLGIDYFEKKFNKKYQTSDLIEGRNMLSGCNPYAWKRFCKDYILHLNFFPSIQSVIKEFRKEAISEK